MRLIPADATLGALVVDIDLRSLNEIQFQALLDAWHEFAVLIFPGQHLTDEEHLAFSRRFGRLEMGLTRKPYRGLAHLTNVDSQGEVAPVTALQNRFHMGNTHWHSDSSYKSVGAKASLLAAHVVPEEGGETEWADMRAAYDVLDAELRTQLQSKQAVHSYVYSHSWHGGLEVVSKESLVGLPAVTHPLVLTHPATGRHNLFIGRHASHIVGEDESSSRAFLQQLTEDACQPPRTWKHRWQAGDLGIWDNRCVLHRGHLWPENQKRVMVRTTVAGDGVNEWAMEA